MLKILKIYAAQSITFTLGTGRVHGDGEVERPGSGPDPTGGIRRSLPEGQSPRYQVYYLF